MTEDEHWARERLREIALAGVREQRRARRWNIFFRLLTIALLVTAVGLLAIPGIGGGSVDEPHTAVVRIDGPIAPGRDADPERIIGGLEAAFSAPAARAVMLEINSPGGTPVAASRIYQAIERLRERHPAMAVYAVAGDTMASGAYYVAAAADEIYVDGASIVGSIGVVSRGFGFADAIETLGIDRRVYTAGDNKADLDPFAPATADAEARIETILDSVHAQFIEAVQAGRGERLNAGSDALFSGRIWSGQASIDLGLTDGIGTPRHVAREVIGAADRVDYTPRRRFIDQALNRLGSRIANSLIDAARWPALQP
jgi:protease-4